MAKNITAVNKSGGDGVIIATNGITRIVAIHAYSTAAGTFAIADNSGDKIKFQVPASGTADIYIGDMGVRCSGSVSVSTPNAGSVTLFVG
jgi:hypothetical protein|tara:strand:+ start:2199 stop:2468 length:270 start_codon:yes stop_codon:yes gene_type:complete